MNATKKRYLYDKMLAEGYESISEFTRNTKLPLAFETVRRAINDGQPINAHSYMLIARYLGFSSSEIKGVLLNPGTLIVESDHRAARIFAELIGESAALTPRQQAGLSLIDKLRQVPDAYRAMMDSLKLVCKVSGIDVEDEVKLLKRG